MCKLLIILGLGILLSGCGSSKLSQAKQVTSGHQKTYQSIVSQTKSRGCRALSNGYLVCPKVARR
ncbi:MAG: hypothetical protein KAG56_03815 [Sulfurovaceae bacterium]|nr:hypothetical protein [Sulfurovaceae bacterium]